MQDHLQLHDAILKGDAKTAKETTEKALADGAEPLKLGNRPVEPCGPGGAPGSSTG